MNNSCSDTDPSSCRAPCRGTYLGIFLVSLAILLQEVLLTRVFSVTMWYHFAFLAITIAMFGLAVGALLVYRMPHRFPQDSIHSVLARLSTVFGVCTLVAFLVSIHIRVSLVPSVLNAVAFILTFLVSSLPFVVGGVVICLVLTRFPRKVASLYASDLVGAAVGCILIVCALKVMDAPSVVMLASGIGVVGGGFFSLGAKRSKRTTFIFSLGLLFCGLSFLHAYAVVNGNALVRLQWVKGDLERTPLYETWNSFSRIIVIGDEKRQVPFEALEPSYSSRHADSYKLKRLNLSIDSRASTSLIAFDGDLEDVSFLKYNINYLAHYVRPDARVLVVGSGGGQDVLTALVFGQKSVVGVELNENILHAANVVFGDLTGHLDRFDNVRFVNDEARSYVASSDSEFDIIQVSFIDTWAATAAGAYVLSENSLYTVEGWKVFLERLSPGGILTFSRWYFEERPSELYRMLSVARQALEELGVRQVNDHFLIARTSGKEGWPAAVGTLLVSKEAFSEKDVSAFTQAVDDLGFEMVLTPTFASDPTFVKLTAKESPKEFIASYPLDISPSTDDRPFFFNMLRFRDVLNSELAQQSEADFNFKAVGMLMMLIVLVLIMTALCLVVPLRHTAKKETVRQAKALFIFFGAIGLGFMLIEIAQLQRLLVLLGHPVYSLSVALFSLLLSSGLGSFSTERIDTNMLLAKGSRRLVLLILVLFVCGLISARLSVSLQEASLALRLLSVAAILSVMGFFMGMAFPLGMKAASSRREELTPWLWGINGATSVCASVLAVAISMSGGISSTYWIGLFCYLIALGAFVCELRKDRAV